MTIVDFIAARLVEVEAAALAASWQEREHGDRWHVWGQLSDRAWVINDQDEEVLALGEAPAANIEGIASHVARHDPEQVLREVETKRKIVAYLTDGVARYEFGSYLAHDLLNLLALPDSTHPDYQQEWAA
jgi:hypothetical protein